MTDVPFISQLGADGSGGNNCGPASLAMLLAYEGVIAPTYGAMLHVADIVRDGIEDGRGQTGGYTTWRQLIDYAGALGQRVRWCGSWRDIYAALDEGQPVIVLLSNWLLLPRQYPVNASFNAHHFVVLAEYRPDRGTFLVNDPLSVYVRGPVEYTALSVVAAVSDIGDVQAVCLEPTWKERAPAEVTAPEVQAALQAAGVTNVAILSDDQARAAAAALWSQRGQAFYPGFALSDAWLDRWREGKYPGLPQTPEIDLPDGVKVQGFDHAAAVWEPSQGVSWEA